MHSPTLLLTSGTIAAVLAGVAPVAGAIHAGSAAASAGPERGLAIVQRGQQVDVSATAPAPGATATGAIEIAASGTSTYRLLATSARGKLSALRLVVVRSSDGARLFDGSLAAFRSLDLETEGAAQTYRVRVTLARGAAAHGLTAGTRLSWAPVQPA